MPPPSQQNGNGNPNAMSPGPNSAHLQQPQQPQQRSNPPQLAGMPNMPIGMGMNGMNGMGGMGGMGMEQMFMLFTQMQQAMQSNPQFAPMLMMQMQMMGQQAQQQQQQQHQNHRFQGSAPQTPQTPQASNFPIFAPPSGPQLDPSSANANKGPASTTPALQTALSFRLRSYPPTDEEGIALIYDVSPQILQSVYRLTMTAVGSKEDDEKVLVEALWKAGKDGEEVEYGKVLRGLHGVSLSFFLLVLYVRHTSCGA